MHVPRSISIHFISSGIRLVSVDGQSLVKGCSFRDGVVGKDVDHGGLEYGRGFLFAGGDRRVMRAWR